MLYIGSLKFSDLQPKAASAQLVASPLPNLPTYVNPLGPDFVTLAIGLTPQLQGLNFDLSNVQGVIKCDLTRPITYLSSACISDLSLLLPITTQANASSVNQSSLFNLSGNYSLSQISLSIGVVSDNLTAGDLQTVTVTATNASSGANIEGAEVSSNVTDPSGNEINQYNGTTDATGQSTFTFTIPTDAEAGTYQVAVTATAPGFEPTTESSTFDVVSFDNSFDNSTNFGDGSSSSSDGSSSSSDGSSSSSDNSDFTSPTVKSTDPKNNDNNVAVDTQITVTFSEKMDKNSIDTGSLSLVPDVGNSASISSVSVSGKSATFTVNNQLLPSMNYLATISSNAQDSAGNFLDCSGSSGVDSLCQWNFQTGTGSVKPVPPVIQLPLPGSVTSTKPIISGTVAGASIVTLKIEVFDDKTSLGTTNADSNGAWSLTPKNALSEGSHTITAVAQNTNNNQKSDSSAPVTFTVCTCAITLSPTSGIVGSPFTVNGTGFDPNTDVTIEFDGSFGTKKSNNNGDFTVTFGVPASTSGTHAVKASEGSKSASKPFTVVPSIALNPTSGPVSTSVNVAGTGFSPSSLTMIKFDSNPVVTVPSAVTPDTKGTFSAGFSVPSSATIGNHTVSATQESNTASQSFTVTSSTSSVKALGNLANSSFAVSNSSSNASNLTNSSKPVSSNLTVSSNAPKNENEQTRLSPQARNETNSISQGNVLRLETSKNNSLVSSSADEKNISDVKNISPSKLRTENNKQVQEKIGQITSQTASKVKDSHLRGQLLNNKVVNISPVAKDDIVTTKQNIPLNIQVLDNDNDPNKKDKLSIIGLSPPQHGRVVSNSNGTFTYIPAPLWTGTDVFEYSVTDGRGGIASSTAKVSVEAANIKNHVPKATAQSVSLKENTHIKILLKAKDSDKDRLSFNILEQPTHGKIVDFSSLTGIMVYIPDANYVGHDTFKFNVNDGKDDSKASKVSLRVIADKHLQDANKIIRTKPNLGTGQDHQPSNTQNGNNTKSAESPKSDQGQQQQSEQQQHQSVQNNENNVQNDGQSQSNLEQTKSNDNVQQQPQDQNPQEQLH